MGTTKRCNNCGKPKDPEDGFLTCEGCRSYYTENKTVPMKEAAREVIRGLDKTKHYTFGQIANMVRESGSSGGTRIVYPVLVEEGWKGKKEGGKGFHTWYSHESVFKTAKDIVRDLPRDAVLTREDVRRMAKEHKVGKNVLYKEMRAAGALPGKDASKTEKLERIQAQDQRRKSTGEAVRELDTSRPYKYKDIAELSRKAGGYVGARGLSPVLQRNGWGKNPKSSGGYVFLHEAFNAEERMLEMARQLDKAVPHKLLDIKAQAENLLGTSVSRGATARALKAAGFSMGHSVVAGKVWLFDAENTRMRMLHEMIDSLDRERAYHIDNDIVPLLQADGVAYSNYPRVRKALMQAGWGPKSARWDGPDDGSTVRWCTDECTFTEERTEDDEH